MGDYDTIAAICTPIGLGSICAIRLSGPCVFNIVSKIFKSFDNEDLIKVEGYRAKYGRIFKNKNLNKDEIIDEVIVLVYRSPKSYTGEDVIEIFCHGGLFICRQVMDSILKNGARAACPGEFTKRAFLNKKITLDKAESIQELISSEFETSKNLSFSSYNGNIGKKIDKIKDMLINLLTNVNVRVDYPEDDFEDFGNENLKSSLKKIMEYIQNLKNTFNIGSIIKKGISVAIVGFPNSGKSSLMNFLSNKEKSIVTNIPGTTRDAIEESILIGDIPVNLIDTAGIRKTDEKIEKIGIERSFEIAKSADLIFMMFDSSKKIKDEELTLLKKFKKEKIIAILNKIDIENKENSNYIVKNIKKNVFGLIKISIKKIIGIDNIKNEIYRFLNFSSEKSENLIITNQRHFDILDKTYKKCEEIIKICDVGWDIVSYILEDSIKELDQFYGLNVNEKVIDEIFSNFCLGK